MERKIVITIKYIDPDIAESDEDLRGCIINEIENTELLGDKCNINYIFVEVEGGK